MRQLRELLRLKTCEPKLSTRGLALRLGVARSTAQDCVNRLCAAALSWPLPDELTDDVLERRLFGPAGKKPGKRQSPEPDWSLQIKEMKRPGVTLQILWEEYRQVHSDGYGYSRFCELYREFELRLSPTMRQQHVAGDKVFVDYSGKKVDIVNPQTGEVLEAEIFVAVLGASNYTYAEATWTQSLPDWIGSHVRMFDYICGCPRLLVPDNLKSGVNKASFYDPEINRTYGRMAEHYGIGVVPARPYRPRDKAKVEAGVRVAQFYILGRLRNRKFFSLGECNQAIREGMTDLNGRVMRRLKVSRSDLYLEIEKPALRPLPATGQGQSRLPCRITWPLLLRAPRSDPTGGRRAYHRKRCRNLPSRQSDRRACKVVRYGCGTSPRHACRAYAARAPSLRRLERSALSFQCCGHWSQHRGVCYCCSG